MWKTRFTTHTANATAKAGGYDELMLAHHYRGSWAQVYDLDGNMFFYTHKPPSKALAPVIQAISAAQH